MENPKNPLEEILESLMQSPRLVKLGKLVQDSNFYQDEVERSLRETIKQKPIPEGIAFIGKMLYDLSQKQDTLSNELCAISLRVETREELEKERDRISELSSELTRVYLRLVVLCSEFMRGVGHSATRLLKNHAEFDIPLNLDTDVEKN